MQVIRSLYNILPKHQGGIVTLGNFDGVHLGHQTLIQKANLAAKVAGCHSMALTFEPHPFEYFNRDNVTIPRLTRMREKLAAFHRYGLDYALILQFNQELASKSASDFVERILVEKLHARHVIVGDDFHFGKGREGDIALLKTLGNRHGFTVEAVPAILLNDERISSTRVRAALAEGNHTLTKQLLGRPYTMQGRIRYGDQLGRQLGFPTANIFLHRRLSPVLGIYTVYVHGLADHPLPGVANVGTRPTVDGTRTLLEVHLLDFNQQIYGCYVEVEFCEKLRDEERYANLNLLKEQIAKDVANARNYFQKQGVL